MRTIRGRVAVLAAFGVALTSMAIPSAVRAAPPTGVYISEFMASNTSTIQSNRGKFDDWIELRNPTASAVDLSGWHLTDTATSLAKWTFPAGASIPANGHLLVFADTAFTSAFSGGEYHANTFGLSASGEYLALTQPDSTIVSEYAPTFPAQKGNVSYGIDSNGDIGYFSTPTPGTANGLRDTLTEPVASVARGFKNAPIVGLTLTANGATAIRYTTDGTTPTATTGTLYSTPINISTTTVLRAISIGTGSAVSSVVSNTYVFVSSVLNQGTGIPGFPNGRQVWVGGTDYVPEDTAMDQSIVTSPTYSSRITGGMTSIPTMSVSAPVGTIFGANGFYDTDNNEVPVSVEVLYPDGTSEMMNGGAESHSHDRLKRSMRLNFSSQYGTNTWVTKLFRTNPVNGDSATTKVRSVILRGGNNRAWTRIWNPDMTDYTLDELYRGTQVAMDGYGSHGTFVHLYLNGVYWGLYNAVERPDDNWAADYFGGDNGNWFWANHGGPSTTKDPARWNYLMDTLVNKDMSVPANYTEMQTYLDIDNFIDYVMMSWWFGQTDWPTNNWYTVTRNASGADPATPTRFIAWDGEWSMDRKLGNLQPTGAWVHPEFLPNASATGPSAKLWQALRHSPTFMARFVQRVTEQTGPGGALTDTAVQARADALNDFVRSAVIGESARWGDSLISLPNQTTRTVDIDWQRAVDSIKALIPGNTARFIAALKAAGYYPNVTAPTFSPAPGNVTGPVTLSAEVGTVIRYTTDGSDPATSGTAQTYSTPLTITQNTRVRAVATFNGQTSPAVEGTYLVPSFMVTEIHYHPADPSTAEKNAGFIDADMFEFVEIRNVSTGPLSLTGLSFDAGITAIASAGTVAAGESVVFVVNEAAFRARYGNAPRIVGNYSPTNLSNGGEQLRMKYPAGVTAFDVTYDDIAPWPVTPDGSGPSLELIDPAGDVTAPTNWRASAANGGTPGDKPPADRTPPTVVSVVPVNGGTNVATTTSVVITFSESVAASSTLGITLAPAAGGSVIATSTTTVGSKVTLQPNVALGNEVTYRVTVPTTVTDLEGNQLASAFTTTFTTAPPLVTQPAEDPTVPPPLAYTPVSPSRRIFDSRLPEFGAAPLPSNTPRVIATGLDGSVTKAVLVNITYVTPATNGFVTAWAAGTDQPRTSNVNALAGEVVANTAVVPVDAQGRIQILTNTSADVVVDLFGRFDTVSGAVRAGRFVPLAPGRLADTREPITADNLYSEIAGSPVSVVRVPVAGRRGVPSTGVASVVLTVTALAGTDDRGGWVAVGAGGTERPATSSVNTNRAGDIRPNLVVVPLGADGTVDLHLFQADDVVVDVAGWFTDATAAASTTGRFHSVTPTREVDTRIPQGFARFDGPAVRLLDPLAVPANAIGVAQNITIVNNGAAGFVTSYPDEERPFASNANATSGSQLRAASAFTRLGSGGVARYYAMMSTDLVVDVTGWFEGAAA